MRRAEKDGRAVWLGRTWCLLIVTVASATLRATGVHSSLLDELIRLSIAPFRMSIPEGEEEKEEKNEMQFDMTHGTVNH